MRNRRFSSILLAAGVASCTPRTPPPVPPPPVAQPQTLPGPARPLPPPAPAAWEDAPLAAGDWSYRADSGRSAASYGTGTATFVIRCEAGRRVSLELAGATAGPMTVRTSYGARNLAAESQPGALVASLSSSEVLLDEIVFSRGRFAVEANGLPRLILPAWAELARVVEDCRG